MRLKVLSAAASLLAVLPGSSQALGLGDIQLKSALNAPLEAEIEVVGATADELAGLKAQLASRDTFARYGLDYPAILSGITVRAVRASDGRNLIQLRSAAPMNEPFVTLLVEANYGRGRQVREYTVLLDPPVFAPASPQAAAPIVAPAVGAGDRSGGVARPAAPAPAPAAAAPAAAAAPVATAAGGQSYQVRRGDTLSGIAATVAGGTLPERRRAMIAIYRGNLASFDGNVNLLRSGSVLRLPDAAAIAAIDPAEASAEIRRQSTAWQSARGETTVVPDARLKLVPPAEPAGSTAAAKPGASSPASQVLQQRVSELETQLAESRRLLELRSAELARLQTRPAPAPAPTPAPAVKPAPTPPPAVVTPPAPKPVPAPAPAPIPAPAVTPPAATTPPPVVEPAPAPAPAPAPVVKKPVEVKPAPADSSGSIVDLLKAYWYAPVALLALLAGLIALRSARSRRREEPDQLRGPDLSGDTTREPILRNFDSISATQPLRTPNVGATSQLDDSFLVEESGINERSAFAAAARGARKIDIDEPAPTVSIPALDGGGAPDHGDPLAEADFHMAYGLYDQAADLVRLAIQREPERRDLKLKLLEVYFVWGNKDEFLATASGLAETRDSAQPGEWEKVVIMGKQLAPDNSLFDQPATGAAAAGVDLNLEGGQNRIDFDLQGEPQGAESGSVDLDLSNVAVDGNESTQVDKDVLDFSLDDPARGSEDLDGDADTARQGVQALRDELDSYSPTVSIPGPESEVPTVEQPRLGDTELLRQKLDGAVGKMGGGEQTTELALDDLGLDLGTMETVEGSTLDDSQVARVLDASDAHTLVADMDDTIRRQIADATSKFADPATTKMAMPDMQPTESGSWLFDEADARDPAADAASTGAGATQAMPALKASDLDFDVDNLNSVTGTHLIPADGETFGLDLDVGTAEQGEVTDYDSTQRVAAEDTSMLPDLEPATMSEVGTKLDLARAYMDMGDPEGARSILAEVLAEGSANQKQEAARLMDSIPG